MSNNLIYKFNDKCDTCLKVFEMVAVVENKKLCLNCLKVKFKEKHGIDPNELKLDENSEKSMNEVVNKIVKKIKKENE